MIIIIIIIIIIIMSGVLRGHCWETCGSNSS